MAPFLCQCAADPGRFDRRRFGGYRDACALQGPGKKIQPDSECRRGRGLLSEYRCQRMLVVFLGGGGVLIKKTAGGCHRNLAGRHQSQRCRGCAATSAVGAGVVSRGANRRGARAASANRGPAGERSHRHRQDPGWLDFAIERYLRRDVRIAGSAMDQLRVEHIFASRDDYDFIRKMSRPMLKAGAAFNYEAGMKTHLGNLRWIQLIGYPAQPGAGDESSWWLLLDRTDIKTAHENLQKNYDRIKDINNKLEEAQNQLLQSEKMASIGQLAAGVAHEINNPLGFVSSNIGALGRYSKDLMEVGRSAMALLKIQGHASTDGPWADLTGAFERFDFEFLAEDLPNLLSETEDGLNRVKRIVQDLKDFSRVDHDEWAEADINQGLDSTLNVVRNEVKYKAEVIKNFAALPRVKCLAAQINQVFMNLIVNAAQAIQEKGRIVLQTELRNGWVVVSVSDTGCGMSEDVKNRIFEPFYTTKPVGQGTGLGLSLSYSIVQKHGGRIEVESSPGAGTRFTVHLPIACAPVRE